MDKKKKNFFFYQTIPIYVYICRVLSLEPVLSTSILYIIIQKIANYINQQEKNITKQ